MHGSVERHQVKRREMLFWQSDKMVGLIGKKGISARGSDYSGFVFPQKFFNIVKEKLY
jgi:hypothetical protein